MILLLFDEGAQAQEERWVGFDSLIQSLDQPSRSLWCLAQLFHAPQGHSHPQALRQDDGAINTQHSYFLNTELNKNKTFLITQTNNDSSLP